MTINDLLEEMEAEHGLMSFGSILKAWRDCEDATQKDYAKKLKISRSYYSDLENERQIPSPTVAASIAKGLGIGEETLIFLALRDYLRAHGFNYKFILEKSA